MVIEVLGWVGAVVVLSGYALFSLGRLPNGPLYQLLNLVGGLCVAVNVAAHGAWPSTIVNGIWAAIAVVVLSGMLRRRRAAARATPAEPVAVAVTEPVAVAVTGPIADAVPLVLPSPGDPVLTTVPAPGGPTVSTASSGSAPVTAPVPIADSVATITGAIAIIALAASQHDDAARPARSTTEPAS